MFTFCPVVYYVQCSMCVVTSCAPVTELDLLRLSSISVCHLLLRAAQIRHVSEAALWS